MLIFKYSKKIDENNWNRIIKNGIKYGHRFPVSYNISKKDVLFSEKKINEFQSIWNKYEDIFRKRIFLIYRYRFPKNINCYINSSPYSSFNLSKKYLSISSACKENRLVPTVLHEASHFLFRKYYDAFCYSIGCSDYDIDNIKEIVTAINDEIFYPMQDGGWEIHQELRKKALKIWKVTSDIEEVIKSIKVDLDKK